MRYPVLRWLLGAGAVAALGAACLRSLPASVVPAASFRAPPASIMTAYVPPGTDLYFGDTGSAVTSVQQRLNQLGYYAGPADGTYGVDLEEAVWAFREVQGLPMAPKRNSVITAAFEAALIRPKPPKVLAPHGGPGRIEVNQSIQVLVLYRHNKPHLILHVSTGGNCLPRLGCGWITPDGSWRALWYDRGTIDAPLGPMKNPIFYIGTTFAIHGGEPVPYYPDSHGCIRIYQDVVNWFHKLVRIGVTRIYVSGTAPYHRFS
jgi:peptidoglycan hydrolase-like protein with peptidoglycan-binding domain